MLCMLYYCLWKVANSWVGTMTLIVFLEDYLILLCLWILTSPPPPALHWCFGRSLFVGSSGCSIPVFMAKFLFATGRGWFISSNCSSCKTYQITWEDENKLRGPRKRERRTRKAKIWRRKTTEIWAGKASSQRSQIFFASCGKRNLYISPVARILLGALRGWGDSPVISPFHLPSQWVCTEIGWPGCQLTLLPAVSRKKTRLLPRRLCGSSPSLGFFLKRTSEGRERAGQALLLADSSSCLSSTLPSYWVTWHQQVPPTPSRRSGEQLLSKFSPQRVVAAWSCWVFVLIPAAAEQDGRKLAVEAIPPLCSAIAGSRKTRPWGACPPG